MTVRVSSRAMCGIVICALIALSGSVALAQTPIPDRQDRRVYDTAGLLDPATEAAMERRHDELYAETGVEIVVLTIPRLEGEEIVDYAVRVGRTWGVGHEDRGVLVVLSLDPRKLFVATGYEADDVLPDARVFQLQRELAAPALAQKNYSAAIGRLTAAMSSIAAEAYGIALDGKIGKRVTKPKAESGCDYGGLVLLGIFAVIAVFGGIFGRKGGGGRGGGGRRRRDRDFADVATGAIAGLAIGSLLGRSSGFGDGGFGGGGGFDGFGGGDFGGGGAGIDF